MLNMPQECESEKVPFQLYTIQVGIIVILIIFRIIYNTMDSLSDKNAEVIIWAPVVGSVSENFQDDVGAYRVRIGSRTCHGDKYS